MQATPPAGPPLSCVHCRQTFAPGSAIISLGAQLLRYHAQCFVCTTCSCSLAEGPSGAPVSVHVKNELPYCGACWTNNFAERCGGCKKPFLPKERIVLYGTKRLHAVCFRCCACGTSLGEGAKHVTEAGKAYCVSCHTHAFAPRCAACQLPLEPGSHFIKLNGQAGRLHPACFKCAECGKQLQASGGHYERDGAHYCEADFKRAFGQQCALCQARLLSWVTAPTGDVYCPSHKSELPACHGCGRLVGRGSGRGGGGIDLADGRSSCAACARTAVHNLSEAQRLLARVHAFLLNLGLPLPAAASINLVLCSRSELLTRNSDHRSAHQAFHCPLGLTCARELRERITECQPCGGPPRQQPPLVRERSFRSIDAVCVLTGLPAALCASTISHELGHVSLHLDEGFGTRLAPALAEGLCELLAFLWLTEGELWGELWGEALRGAETGVESPKDREARVSGMLQNTDRIYGGGFRDALAAYYATGSSLTALLREVKRLGRLPGTAFGAVAGAMRSPLRLPAGGASPNGLPQGDVTGTSVAQRAVAAAGVLSGKSPSPTSFSSAGPSASPQAPETGSPLAGAGGFARAVAAPRPQQRS